MTKGDIMSLIFHNKGKNCRESTIGEHHYSIEGDYYNGFEVFYAKAKIRPQNGPDWELVDKDNSLGKGEQSARRHFRKIRSRAS